MRNLKPHSNFDLAVAEFCDCPIKIAHAVDQDRLISLKMLCQKQSWRIGIQSDHRHTSPKGLDRKDQLGTQLVAEVHDVRSDITAG